MYQRNAQSAATDPQDQLPIGWFRKSICLLFSAALINTLAVPLAQAHAQQRRLEAMQELAQPSPAERYAQGFADLEQLFAQSDAGTAPPSIGTFGAPISPYAQVRQSMQAQAEALQSDWLALRSTWQQAGVSTEILRRQQATEAAFQSEHQKLLALLQAVEARPGDASAMQALQDFVKEQGPRKTHLPINLGNLPWQVEPPKPQMPAVT